MCGNMLEEYHSCYILLYGEILEESDVLAAVCKCVMKCFKVCYVW